MSSVPVRGLRNMAALDIPVHLLDSAILNVFVRLWLPHCAWPKAPAIAAARNPFVDPQPWLAGLAYVGPLRALGAVPGARTRHRGAHR